MSKHFSSPHITLIRVFGKSFCQIDKIHDRRERTLHGPLEGIQAAYDLTGSRIRRYTSHLRPHWIQNLTHKINILQGLGHPEQSPRPTLPEQSTSRDFSWHQDLDGGLAGDNCRTTCNLRHAWLQLLEWRHELALRY
jgi:hypothetical protein